MPEGDTVLLTARRLDAALSGRALERAELRWPRVPVDDLTGTQVLRTWAYGKHILTELADGRTLRTHLRMDGSWRVARTGTAGARAAGSRVRAVLANTTWTCVGDQLGMLDLVRTRDLHTLLGHLGPDILADSFLPDPGAEDAGAGLAEAVRRASSDPGRPIGDVLLDQQVVAGIGTLFAAEGLFELQVWPWDPVDSCDLASLLTAIRRNLVRGVVRPVDGRRVHVHARRGRPCVRCGTPLERGTSGIPPRDRPMFYCPRCQVPSSGAERQDATNPAP
ncbi:DNA-formamidopyrimidine glycosylase family protein [Sanguibacter suaedae]|uniref:DNA-(apurinic or apyrimidinic site) lyase n=1 Tax=Sanguibacter suaedae TaxID=2795737 RepID=A0A934IEK6_9MICO|nr:DNA-formamidopyrimidine glycosylase family protein [Sanguibacter suaedae]MBI9115509.1 Fpg/Nei family DNA glycosylase [Sanguibacter suaedae]